SHFFWSESPQAAAKKGAGAATAVLARADFGEVYARLRHLGQDVGAFRDYGDGSIGTVRGQAIGHGLLDAGGRFHKQLIEPLGGYAVADHLYLGLAANLRHLLKLPLIHHKIVFAENPLDEDFQVGMLAEEALELWAADAFGQAGGHDDRAALLDHRQRPGHAFDRLVERGVERVTGATGYNHVDRIGQHVGHDAAAEPHAFFKRLEHVAGYHLE